MSGSRGRPLAWLVVLAGLCAPSPALADASILPERLRVVIEPCPAIGFDVEGYARALRIELAALDVAEPAASEPVPELHVASPDCDGVIVLALSRDAERREITLRAEELPAAGRERALALATIERVQRAWAELRGPATTPAPGPVPPTAPPPAPPPLPARRQRPRHASSSHAEPRPPIGQGALSAGLRFSTASPLASLALSLDRTLSRTLALGGGLAWHSEAEGLAEGTDAHSITLGPRAELSLWRFDALDFAAALGLFAGAGWVVTPRAGADGSRVASSPAPLAFASAMLGLRAELGLGVFAQTGAVMDYALLGARFDTRHRHRLASLTGARFAAFIGAGARFGR